MALAPLPPDALYRRCDADALGFRDTAELEPLEEVLGQPRAVAALRFGVGIRRDGYNLFALGPVGVGKRTLVEEHVRASAQREAVPDDWCYVHNFQRPYQPRALRLPPGRGQRLQSDMEQLLEDLRAALPAAFQSEEYRTRRQAIEDEFKEQEEQALAALRKEAEGKGIALLRTPAGFAFAPLRQGEVMDPESYEKLPDEEKKRIDQDVEALQGELKKTLHKAPQWRKAMRDRIKTLNRETAAYAVGALLEALRQHYQDLGEVQDYLQAVEADVVDHAQFFLQAEEVPVREMEAPGSPFNRYRVNLLVDHAGADGAPVVVLDNPTYQNLVGRIEHQAQMGALITDFTLIKPGALHRANGGYLIIDANKVLLQPFAWDALKRALTGSEIRIESLGQALSLVSTMALEPEPIPLNVKVVLLGDRLLYYLLSYYDPEFTKLFKVAVDFEVRVERSHDNHRRYARLLAGMVRREGLRHLDRHAVARVIEHAARMVEDAERLSIHMGSVVDLLREADFWAGESEHELITAADVQRAIDARIYRLDRIRERTLEAILRNTVLIDTAGAVVGQVNGLSVLTLGGFNFGQPSRITARVRLGDGEVVDIEREVELGGPIHSKGVLILSGFLGGRYAPEHTLSLSASLVFEQSYGEVEGDSASSAELYALLSALAGVPIRQCFAVTGSVNQRGQVQAIGGVNEKIEGFFDVCRARGLTGDQGVLIPAANVPDLMLRADVVAAVEAGQFAVYAVEHVDQGIELLTGLPAGRRGPDGKFPPESINGKVEATLEHYAALHHAHKEKEKEDEGRHQGGHPPPPATRPPE